ncbi:MAG: class I SAM-dependent rRNA methyltransferase [Candidatus Kapaibacterium sp.]
MFQLRLKNHHDRRIRGGHPWVFSNELQDVPALESGSIVEVLSHRGESFGVGLYNPKSLISVRLLNSKIHELSMEFFIERLQSALALRQRIFSEETSYRLVFGESDLLPGVVIDRYGDYFSLQILSAGMDSRIDMIVSALLAVFPATKGICEKNTSHLRQLEGLELRDGVIFGEIPDDIAITENGLQLSVSLLGGQKTGYFLDQKINRMKVREIARDLRIVDCFCNQGGFALNAAAGGAAEAVGVDISGAAVAAAARNATLNSLSNTSFQKEDVFAFLKSEVASKKSWDCVILDPPSFTKSKKNVPAAKKGYAEINRLALQLLPIGGFLVSASCSQHIYEETFLEIIHHEASKLGRNVRIIFRGGQSPDHPILLGMPETEYLKFFIFQVVG